MSIVASELGDPGGIVLDREGALYVAETALHRIIRIFLPAPMRLICFAGERRGPLNVQRVRLGAAALAASHLNLLAARPSCTAYGRLAF